MKNSLIYICLALVACNSSSGRESTSGFRQIGNYEIDLDRYTSTVEEYFQYVPDWKGEEVVAFHVRKNNTIKLYNLSTGELQEQLDYAQDGPKAFPNIYDFHIHDHNNIFLNRRYHYKLHLVDEKFNLKRTFEFLDPEVKLDPNSGLPQAKDTFLPVFSYNRIFKKFEDYFILTGSPDMNPDFSNYFSSESILVKIKNDSGDILKLCGYPNKLQGKAWGSFHAYLFTDFSPKKDSYYLSYAADNEIYVRDRNFSEVISFDAFPDKYRPISPIPSAARESEKAYLAHYNQQYVFGSVLYDDYRDLVYRIALEPNPDYGDIFVRDPLYRPRNMVVMAFDSKKNYEKVAEMRLEQSDSGVYLDRCFVNEKGLSIAYVDMENEDKLYFKTFLVK